jgi:hypothetical protein
MNRICRFVVLMGLAAAMLAPATSARAFGDYPNDYFVPGIDVGCWRWNWYQHAYYNVCPVYPSPKAYMYPRRAPVVIGSKG